VGTWGQVVRSLCFRTIVSVAVFVLWGLASVPAQPTSDADRCKSIDVRGTSVPLDEAVATCTAIIDSGREGDKNLAEIHVLRGTALTRKNEFDRALVDFDQAIHIDPAFAKAHNARGLLY
jgi:Tfp pilus assembly protein PilF